MKGVIEPDLFKIHDCSSDRSSVRRNFRILIGIPVLRLNGDYLAIVTLAFGEIIKNVINVFYIGKDSKGFHFSMKDSVSLNMEPDGKILLNGPQGISGTPKDSTFTIGFYINSDHTCHCSESDQLQNRTRDHGDFVMTVLQQNP